jgi:ribosome silencing factor RsfS/YbeB/iojap
VEIDGQEIARGGVSYTIDTVRNYARNFPGAELFCLIGADQTGQLHLWREAAELARLAQFLIIPRPGESLAGLAAPFRGRALRGWPVGVSSSEIRSPRPWRRRWGTIAFIFEADAITLPKMDSKKLALLCRKLAENKKAENSVILDVRKLSSVTDYFVIVSGAGEPHLRAIANEVTDKLREEYQVRPRAIDGDGAAAWQVLDYFDVILHIMRADVREKYDLESLWGDAPRIGARKARRSTTPPGARQGAWRE